MQEAVLAARLVIWCGALQFNFEVLGRSSIFLWRSGWWGQITADVRSRQQTGGFGYGISRVTPASILASSAASLALTDGPGHLHESESDTNGAFDSVYVVLQIHGKRTALGTARAANKKDPERTPHRPETSYEDIFTSFRLLEATEPKDKIYAFLGLRPSDSIDAFLMPDYRKDKSCQMVYMEAMAYVLQTAQTLDLLAYREDTTRGRDSSLPSWVPDLRKPVLNLIQGASLTPWSAAADVPIRLEFHGTHKNVLSIDGCC